VFFLKRGRLCIVKSLTFCIFRENKARECVYTINAAKRLATLSLVLKAELRS